MTPSNPKTNPTPTSTPTPTPTPTPNPNPNPKANQATTEKDDRVRQGSVLYMGALAKHIAPDDPKIVQVVQRLLDTLGTPSEQVQRTISLSLAGLVGKAAVKPQAAEHIEPLTITQPQP